MRKLLLVLLVGLLSVASFATVSFSGKATAGVSVTMDAAGNITLDIPWSGYFVAGASDSSTNTEFCVYFGMGFDTALAGYVQQYLYKTDALSVRYRLGKPKLYTCWNPWGTYYVYNDAAALALLFDMASGDLTDSLGVYAYFPDVEDGEGASVDLDVVNSLSFLYFTIDVAAKGIVSAGATGFPEIGTDVTVDLGTALGLPEGSSLSAFAYLGLDPSAEDVTGMLSDYMVGVDFGYDTVTGSFSFAGPTTPTIAASFKTTALNPVTLGGSVSFPVDLGDVSDLTLSGYLKWAYELLNNKVSVTYDGDVTAKWIITVSY